MTSDAEQPATGAQQPGPAEAAAPVTSAATPVTPTPAPKDAGPGDAPATPPKLEAADEKRETAAAAAVSDAPKIAVEPRLAKPQARTPLWKQRSLQIRAALAAGLVIASGLGGAAGYLIGQRQAAQREARLSTDMARLRSVLASVQWKGTEPTGPRASEDLRKLSSDLRAVRAQVDLIRSERASAMDDLRAMDRRVAGLKEAVEKSRTEGQASTATLRAQLDRLAADQTAATSQLTAALRQSGDGLVARLSERLEKTSTAAASAAIPGASSAPAAAAPVPATSTPAPAASMAAAAPEPATTASLAKPQPKALHGWTVRGVYNGVALLEGPRGVIEIAKGETFPEIGRVDSMERKGRSWTVTTSRGVISSQP
jgi:hypothetical protein